MNYRVFRGEKELSVHTAAIFPPPYHRNRVMEYIQFTAQYPVCLTIHSDIAVTDAVIRPLRLGLTPEISDGILRIWIEKPVKFSLEINRSAENNLLVLAEEERYEGFLKEEDAGREGKLWYFEKGVHDVGVLTVAGNDVTVYMEEGAYIHGKIDLDHCERVLICGYGVISMEKYPYEMRHTYQRCINAMYCRDLTIRDITIMDSNDWSLRVFGCDRVLVDNVKIIGCRGNSDGVDVCGSRDVLVQNVFTRVWDDSLVVKALDTGNAENITFRSCILWNDFARPMEVGVELRADEVKHIRFEDIDVLHSPTGYPLMGIHHGDRAVVSDVVFEDIRIEDAPGAQLFDIRITPSYWNRDSRMGCIRDVVFRNIRVTGSPGIPRLMSNSRLQGYDEEHDIKGVSVENLSILGKTVHDAKSLGLLCMNYVDQVSFRADEASERLKMIETGMEWERPLRRKPDGSYEGVLGIWLDNPHETAMEKEIRLEISPAHTGEYDRERRRVLLPAKERVSLSWPISLPAGKYVIALQSVDPEICPVWQYVPLDWILTRGRCEESLPIPFVNYYGDRLGSMRAWIQDDCLALQSELLEREDCRMIVYAARPVPCRKGEVLFSVEETDFGEVPAVINGEDGPEAAPQLRCPLEITLVFKNEPKVEEIRSAEVSGQGPSVKIPLADLGLAADTEHFWLEIEARLPEVAGYRYPYTLFHSVTPITAAHIYGNCRILKEETFREE